MAKSKALGHIGSFDVISRWQMTNMELKAATINGAPNYFRMDAFPQKKKKFRGFSPPF